LVVSSVVKKIFVEKGNHIPSLLVKGMNEKSSGLVLHELDGLGVGAVPVGPGDSDFGTLGLKRKRTMLVLIERNVSFD
jgi:hypothetical protein